ncbi:MFS general substrate transporter [Ophiobolus disseminans]|uniref:MFS general substrate transporter n=1 Tax=Ophiobolus disseminans TaxID=1469910 RepID=A0A6A7A065_9PLEO|nr:MFS general substrate transporter [Ophiobolus disseminans]
MTATDSTPATKTSMYSTTSTKPPAPPMSGPPEVPYKPFTLSFILVITSVYLAFFLIALDRMIIATAVPAITNSFDSISDIGWYGSAYMLTCAIFNPLFGSIYKFYDTKWTFMFSVVIFEAGSAVCAAAPDSASFIVGRAVAGIGAAGISCGAIMIVIGLVPLHKRPVFTSFFGMAFGVSSVLGPVVGGIFTDSARLTWRWCFWINLPIGAFTLLVIFFFLSLPPPPPQKKAAAALPLLAKAKRLDPLGLLFFVPSIICLILALQWGGTEDAWSAPKIIGLLVTFAVLFIAFLIIEFKMPDTAMAPPRVVLNRSVGSSLFFTFMSSGGMMSAVYYLAIWLQAAQGQSAMDAGIRMIPLVVSLVLFGIITAIFTQKIGYYVPALLVAPIIASVGAGMLSTLVPSSSRAAWMGYQILYGFGIGAGAQTASLAAQTVLPREDIPLGTAMGFFAQQLGGAIFVPVGQNIFTSALVKRLSGVAGLDVTTIIDTGATDLRKVVPTEELSTVLDAYSYASTRVFVLSAALSACMMLGALGVEWKSIKKAKPEAPKKVVDEEKGPTMGVGK